MSMLPGGAEKPSTPQRGAAVAGAGPAAGAMSAPKSDDAKTSAVTARRGECGDRRERSMEAVILPHGIGAVLSHWAEGRQINPQARGARRSTCQLLQRRMRPAYSKSHSSRWMNPVPRQIAFDAALEIVGKAWMTSHRPSDRARSRTARTAWL